MEVVESMILTYLTYLPRPLARRMAITLARKGLAPVFESIMARVLPLVESGTCREVEDVYILEIASRSGDEIYLVYPKLDIYPFPPVRVYLTVIPRGEVQTLVYPVTNVEYLLLAPPLDKARRIGITDEVTKLLIDRYVKWLNRKINKEDIGLILSPFLLLGGEPTALPLTYLINKPNLARHVEGGWLYAYVSIIMYLEKLVDECLKLCKEILRELSRLGKNMIIITVPYRHLANIEIVTVPRGEDRLLHVIFSLREEGGNIESTAPNIGELYGEGEKIRSEATGETVEHVFTIIEGMVKRRVKLKHSDEENSNKESPNPHNTASTSTGSSSS